MNSRILSGLLALPLLVSAPVQAAGVGIGLATVSDIDGVVLVSDGERFSTAAVGAGLMSGSRIMTMEGASATVTYGDGCQLKLAGNTLAVLRKADECTLDAVDTEAVGPKYASLGNPATLASTTSAGSASTVAATTTSGAIGTGGGGGGMFGLSPAGSVAAVAAAGTAGFFILVDNDGDDDPISGETF